jgi:hypothetical protein
MTKQKMVLSSGTHMDIEVDSRQVCRYLGYKADIEPSPRIASLLDECMGLARQLLQPAYSHIFKDIQAVRGSQVFVEDGLVLRGNSISRLLSKCAKVALFVLTIGGALEEMAGRLANEGLIVKAYVLDAIGSAAAEKLADLVQDSIASAARAEGLCISRRFSPGYCDWDIGQQQIVFSALGGEFAGVHLTEDCLMVPQKSVSGLIGMGRCDGGVDTYNPCDMCGKRTCPWRRK